MDQKPPEVQAGQSAQALPGLLQGRYQPGRLLSQHGAVATWLGEDQQSGNQVVIKRLELRTLENWKQLELFEREVALLKHLQHPGLPRLLDHFQVQESSG
ncbi:MAG: hypothetical protein ACAI44_07225, partial [Candidatus Sericytochromatia bacterium]